MGFGRIKKGRSSQKRDFCFSMHGKNKESFNRAQSFLKKEGGRVFLGRKDFLGKEVFKRREVLTNKRGEGEKESEKKKKKKDWGEQKKFFMVGDEVVQKTF